MVGAHRESGVDGTVGGRFRIVSPLGQGGTADVFLALADGPGGFRKLVVLKVLRGNLAQDQEFRSMFLREARLAARLRHANVVQTNEVIEIDGAPVIVMEYLDGQPLSQVIVHGREAGFTQAMEIRLLVDALHGLHAAHELTDFGGKPLGVVHRDVSPQNLFVTVDGQAKVLDFGIAKLERSMAETEVGTIKGRIRYMAPEQITGERLTRRADLYSAGVILWEALVGERMWKGCSEAEIRRRVVEGRVPAPTSVRADAPQVLARICERALARDPGARPASALELADAIEGALPVLGPVPTPRQIGATVATLFAAARERTQRALGSLSTTSSASLPALASAPDAALPSAAHAPPRRSRSRWLGAALLALALALGLPAVLAPARSSQGTPDPTTRASAAPRLPGAVVVSAAAPSAEPMVATAGVPEAGHKLSPRGFAVRPMSRRLAHKSVAPELPEPTPPSTDRDCQHPFFFDANGIKKLRPECM